MPCTSNIFRFDFSENKDGIKVVGVQSGSPGLDAGLRIGDIVLEIDGKKIKKLEDYVEISREAKDKKSKYPWLFSEKGLIMIQP